MSDDKLARIREIVASQPGARVMQPGDKLEAQEEQEAADLGPQHLVLCNRTHQAVGQRSNGREHGSSVGAHDALTCNS